MKLLRVLIIFILFLVTGCGDGDSASVPSGREEQGDDSEELAKVFWGSCKEIKSDMVTEVKCQEWYGENYRGLNMKHACQNFAGGEFSDQKCKTEELVGACLRDHTSDSENRFYYYQSVWTRESAIDDCTQSDAPGEWSEPEDQGSLGPNNDRRGRRWQDRRGRRHNNSLQTPTARA